MVHYFICICIMWLCYYHINYFVIPIEIIAILIMLIILLSLSAKFISTTNNKGKKNISSRVKMITILCIITFISTLCVDLLHAISSECYKIPSYFERFMRIRLISDSLYFASSLCLYSILLTKLYMVFKHIIYYLSYKYSILFCALLQTE